MDFNNNNSFNYNMNPYFTPTSFDSDNSNPAMYNMNQPYRSDMIDLELPNRGSSRKEV